MKVPLDLAKSNATHQLLILGQTEEIWSVICWLRCLAVKRPIAKIRQWSTDNRVNMKNLRSSLNRSIIRRAMPPQSRKNREIGVFLEMHIFNSIFFSNVWVCCAVVDLKCVVSDVLGASWGVAARHPSRYARYWKYLAMSLVFRPGLYFSKACLEVTFSRRSNLRPPACSATPNWL